MCSWGPGPPGGDVASERTPGAGRPAPLSPAGCGWACSPARGNQGGAWRQRHRGHALPGSTPGLRVGWLTLPGAPCWHLPHLQGTWGSPVPYPGPPRASSVLHKPRSISSWSRVGADQDDPGSHAAPPTAAALGRGQAGSTTPRTRSQVQIRPQSSLLEAPTPTGYWTSLGFCFLGSNQGWGLRTPGEARPSMPRQPLPAWLGSSGGHVPQMMGKAWASCWAREQPLACRPWGGQGSVRSFLGPGNRPFRNSQ